MALLLIACFEQNKEVEMNNYLEMKLRLIFQLYLAHTVYNFARFYQKHRKYRTVGTMGIAQINLVQAIDWEVCFDRQFSSIIIYFF